LLFGVYDLAANKAVAGPGPGALWRRRRGGERGLRCLDALAKGGQVVAVGVFGVVSIAFLLYAGWVYAEGAGGGFGLGDLLLDVSAVIIIIMIMI
jgi:hypothetical protein